MHEGKLTPRTVAGLGAEPLLLPVDHSDQRRDHSFARHRSVIPPRLAETHCGSRRQTAKTKRDGGILRWIKLAEATGLDRERVTRADEVLPATRFIGNEYLNLVRTRPFLECVASSLTELFSRDLISLRMEKLRQHYPWLASALDYFEARLTEAPEDAAFAHPVRVRPRRHARRAGGRHSGIARQVRHSLGAARRALFRLCRAGLAAAGRVSD